MLVLHGADGQRRDSWAQQFADEGFDALAIRWFGDDGIVEVPVETISTAAAWLWGELGRPVAVAAHSKGSELALVAAAHCPGRVQAVLAWAPTAVAWYGSDPSGDDSSASSRSSWSLGGQPLPYMAGGAPPRESERGIVMRSCYECLPDRDAGASVIPIERFPGRILLASGTDDQFWPAEEMAGMVVARMARYGRGDDGAHLSGAGAGHLITPDTAGLELPGIDMGGSPDTDRHFALRAWRAAVEFLRDLPARQGVKT